MDPLVVPHLSAALKFVGRVLESVNQKPDHLRIRSGERSRSSPNLLRQANKLFRMWSDIGEFILPH